MNYNKPLDLALKYTPQHWQNVRRCLTLGKYAIRLAGWSADLQRKLPRR